MPQDGPRYQPSAGEMFQRQDLAAQSGHEQERTQRLGEAAAEAERLEKAAALTAHRDRKKERTTQVAKDRPADPVLGKIVGANHQKIYAGVRLVLPKSGPNARAKDGRKGAAAMGQPAACWRAQGGF